VARTHVSDRSLKFTESVIREMTRLCNRHGGVNLAQGFPDFPAPAALKQAAMRAIDADVNQYAITWGARSFRDALVAKTRSFSGLSYDPDTEVTVCCGSTECMAATMLALVNPGDEVIVFEPFYENYGPDAILCGAEPRFVRLSEPDWTFDPGELERAFGNRTKAIVINTPNNPTERCSRGGSWSRWRPCVASGTWWRSPTRSTNTSSTTASLMCRWPPSRACASEP
jgi:aminotransferase